ncbi:MAG: diaminopimelate epimerase [Phycisphaeraceae bacterium]
MRFTKMHGLGNDYVYVNGFDETVPDPAALAPRIADRHFGVGGDGLILLLPPEAGVDAHVRMRMFNADGSEAEMCGNGVRCVCKLAHDRGITTANPMRIQTGNGVLSLAYTTDGHGKVDQVTVNMGEPVLDPVRVPVLPDKLVATDQAQTFRLAVAPDGETRVASHVPSEPGVSPAGGRDARPTGSVDRQDTRPTEQPAFDATFVSMGNPHATIFVPDVQAIDLERLGPRLEHHSAFPNRMNVHFVQVHGPDEVTMRTWERGSGVTLACGTGASAVAVAGVLTDRTARTLTAHLPGGDLTLEWREADGHLYMTGPATEVFTGEWLG